MQTTGSYDPTFLIIHPRAQLRHPKKFATLIKTLERSGRPFATRESRHAEDITSICREALESGYQRIMPLGGDGTLSLCVQAFMEDGRNLFPEAALLPLPFGTGNDFFRGFVAREEPKDWTWINGPMEKIDLNLGTFSAADGRIRYFINSFSAGITADVLRDYSRSRLRSYLISTLKTLRHFQAERIEVAIDGSRRKKTTLLFMICKGAFVGGGMRLHKAADHGSGHAKVVWIPSLSAGAIAKSLPRLYRGGIEGIPAVEAFDMPEQFVIELGREKNWIEVDGELCEVTKELRIGLLRSRLSFLRPRSLQKPSQ